MRERFYLKLYKSNWCPNSSWPYLASDDEGYDHGSGVRCTSSRKSAKEYPTRLEATKDAVRVLELKAWKGSRFRVLRVKSVRTEEMLALRLEAVRLWKGEGTEAELVVRAIEYARAACSPKPKA